MSLSIKSFKKKQNRTVVEAQTSKKTVQMMLVKMYFALLSLILVQAFFLWNLDRLCDTTRKKDTWPESCCILPTLLLSISFPFCRVECLEMSNYILLYPFLKMSESTDVRVCKILNDNHIVDTLSKCLKSACVQYGESKVFSRTTNISFVRKLDNIKTYQCTYVVLVPQSLQITQPLNEITIEASNVVTANEFDIFESAMYDIMSVYKQSTLPISIGTQRFTISFTVQQNSTTTVFMGIFCSTIVNEIK